MSLESVFANPPPLVGADLNQPTTTLECHKQSSLDLEGDTQPVADSQTSTRSLPEDLEDGEIEDGEIDDGVTDEISAEKGDNSRKNSAVLYDEHASPQKSYSDEESDEDERSRKRKKKKKKKDKKKDEKSKKKRRRYVDHDRVSDDYPGYLDSDGAWQSYPAPGPYDSPQQYSVSPRQDRGPPPTYQDLEGSYPLEDPDRSPPHGYHRDYDSPPGLYDSPSEDESYGPPPKLQRYDSVDSPSSHKQRSMLNTCRLSEELMDAGVAATEKEEVFQRNSSMGPNKKRRPDKNSFYRDKPRSDQPVIEKKKRPLASMPMSERPQCYFYLEGKCQKGNDCQFNHNFELPKKFSLCKYFLNGFCTKGNDCFYMHGDYPCKFYHLEGKCPKGNDCRFSHEELSPETREQFRQQQLDYEHKQRSPQHRGNHDDTEHYRNMGNQYRDDGRGMASPSHGNRKKIPSIFDIEVFPPGKGPRPPGSSGSSIGGATPPNMSAPGAQSAHTQGAPLLQAPQPPMRPRFYSEPPAMGGGGNPGPRQTSLLGPPPVRFMRGMRPPGPGMRPRGGAPRGPLLGPCPSGMGGPMRAGGPGYFNNGNFYGGGPKNMAYDGPNPNDDPNTASNSNNDTDDRPRHASTNPDDDGNSNLSANQGDLDGGELEQSSDQDALTHLPPKQRALFMRIKQQQRDHDSGDQNSHHDQDDREAKVEDWYSSDDDDSSPHKHTSTSTRDQDNSSLVNNLWNSLAKGQNASPSQVAPSGTNQSTGNPGQSPSSYNVAHMITAIRRTGSGSASHGQGPSAHTNGGAANVNSVRDPRQKSDPRLMRHNTDPRSLGRNPGNGEPHTGTVTMATPQLSDEQLEVDGSIAVQTRQGRRVLYVLRALDFVVRPRIPSSVNMKDDRYKDDPRIQKALNKLESPKAETRPSHKPSPAASTKSSGSLQSPPADASKSLSDSGAKSLTVPSLSGSETLLSEPKIQRALSAPLGLTLEGPSKSLEPPTMPDALKERPINSRRLSSDHTGGGDTSPRAKDASSLSYRNDPRYRKKKVGVSAAQDAQDLSKPPAQTSTGSPQSDAGLGAGADGDSVGTAAKTGPKYSPVAAGPDPSLLSGGYGFYNRPSADNFQQFQDKKAKAAHSISGSLDRPPGEEDPNLSGDQPTKNVDAQSENPELLDETSLRDMFVTKDPTASPFC